MKCRHINNNNNTSICKAHIVSIRAESELLGGEDGYRGKLFSQICKS